MKGLKLECAKCGRQYQYSPVLFTCTGCNSPGFTNLLLRDPNGALAENDEFEHRKTPCYKIPELNRALGMPELFIKDETFNRFGTMKDRRSDAIVRLARHHDFSKIFCVTAGNLGNSLAEFAGKNGIECISVAPKDIPKKILERLEKKTSLTKVETLFDPSQIWTAKKISESFPQAMDGTGNNPCAAHAYTQIAEELSGLDPDMIVVPLGSGELFCGICQGIEERDMRAKVIGVSVCEKNPVGQALRLGKEEIALEGTFEERTANKIAVQFTPLLPVIMHFISKGHRLIELTDKEIADSVFEYQPYFEHAIEQSSLSVFAALEKLAPGEKGKRIVCVLTGRNHVNETLRHR